MIKLNQLVDSIESKNRKDIVVEGMCEFGMQYDRLDKIVSADLSEWQVVDVRGNHLMEVVIKVEKVRKSK